MANSEHKLLPGYFPLIFPTRLTPETLPTQLQTVALTMEAISKLAASHCGKLQSRGWSKPCQGFKSLYCRTVSQNTSRPCRSNSCTRSGSSPQPIDLLCPHGQSHYQRNGSSGPPPKSHGTRPFWSLLQAEPSGRLACAACLGCARLGPMGKDAVTRRSAVSPYPKPGS